MEGGFTDEYYSDGSFDEDDFTQTTEYNEQYYSSKQNIEQVNISSPHLPPAPLSPPLPASSLSLLQHMSGVMDPAILTGSSPPPGPVIPPSPPTG